MPRPYKRLRETTFDLYVERDLLPGYYKFISTFCSWLAFCGYILFAIIFTTPEDDLRAVRTLLTVIASTLLFVGYAGVVAVALLSKSLLFLIEGVICPILTASLLGLFTTLANWGLRKHVPVSTPYLSVPIVVGCLTTVVSAVMMFIAYRELWQIRRKDERRRWHVQLRPQVGVQPDSRRMIIPGEDEAAQRRQLMRLLHDRHESITNQEDVNNTFKIDLPHQNSWTHQGGAAWDRDRSELQGGFNISSLLSWKKATNGTFKDPRQKRREEIERSSISNLNEAWRSAEPNQPGQNPSWGWPPATRYA